MICGSCRTTPSRRRRRRRPDTPGRWRPDCSKRSRWTCSTTGTSPEGDLARTLTGRELPDDGALFTAPSRHFLVFHPLEDQYAVGAVNDPASFGLGAYQDNPGPLSPRIYWWHKGAVTCLTRIDDATTSFSVVPPDGLMTILRRLKGAAS